MYMKLKVTVLMPVYNGEKYLKKAIESILNQTFKNFELLIIDDGSMDSSVEIIKSYADPRIKLIHNDKNLNLPESLNKGIDIAQTEYIARMDADDISLPHRLETQVKFMNENPNIDVCGSFVKRLDKQRQIIWKFPTEDSHIKAGLLFKCCLSHPTIMMRTSSIKKYNLYYSVDYIKCEDYEFWARASEFLNFANIEDPLLLYKCASRAAIQLYNEERI